MCRLIDYQHLIYSLSYHYASYIFSSKKIFIVISVMRERVGSIHDTFNLYLASWWSICSCNLHLSLQLLISVFNCAEIFFHESGYFMTKVSIIQNNLDENNLPFLPFILKRFTLFFQEIKNQLIHTAMVNHSNFDIALSISNYLTSLMITTPFWSIHPWWMTNEVTGHPFNTFLIDFIFVIQELYRSSKLMFLDLLQKQTWGEANKVTF